MLIILSIYLIALACWLGGIVFFSFFTTRIVFASLPRAEAGVAIRALFPQYYMLGYVAGAVSLVLAIYITAVRTPRVWWGGTTSVMLNGAVLLLNIAAIVGTAGALTARG